MNIIKSLHAGILYKTFLYGNQNHFSVSILWGFRLDTGEPVLEQKLWEAIGGILGKNELFDAAMPKANGEVLVHGSFFAPGEEKVRTGTVSVAIGSIRKTLHVFGNRSWIQSFGSAVGIDGPEWMTEMPVTYANAFGGEGYDRNPLGKGHAVLNIEASKIHPLPNIEYPDQRIASPGDRPEPAAFSRIDPMWAQRFSKAGTYDQNYIETQMPGLPDDIDWTYFNDAAPDQWVAGYFQGDEAFEIQNMNRHTPVQAGRLPGVCGRCFINRGFGDEVVFQELETRLDTVWFFPADNLGLVIHRGRTEVVSDDGDDVAQILIAHENLSDLPRNPEHYREELAKRMDPEEGFKFMMNTIPLIPEGCRCGFEMLKEVGGFPLEGLFRENTDSYIREKHREMRKELNERKEKMEADKAEAAKRMEQAGLDPKLVTDAFDFDPAAGDPSPESREIERIIEKIAPGIGKDPENFDMTRLNLKGFDDLRAFSDRMVSEKRREIEEKLREELTRLKAMEDFSEKNELLLRIENSLLDLNRPPALPRPNLDAQIRKARARFLENQKQMLLNRSMGISEAQLEAWNRFDFDEIENQIKEGIRKIDEGYRIGAHCIEASRSPHEGKEPEIAAALVKAYKEGGNTAGGDYAFCDLSGLNLSGIDLRGAYLEYANLTDANLTDADLGNAILAHADLTRTDLTRANLTGANIGAAAIIGTRFIDADLTGAILGKARIEAAVFHRCRLVERMEMFMETSFVKVDFSGSDLKKSNFIDSDISGCIFASADLSESNFINPKMDGTDFEDAILRSVNFVQAKAENVQFSHAEMKNARFVGGCIMPGADFSGANAGEANLRDCQLQNADFSGAFLQKADFGGSDLTGAKFVRANAVQARFNKANLVYADLYRIHLMEGSLYKARLSAARFTEANLYSVNFMGSIVGEEGMEDADFTDACM